MRNLGDIGIEGCHGDHWAKNFQPYLDWWLKS